MMGTTRRVTERCWIGTIVDNDRAEKRMRM
jgi:hypothetical protein